MVTEGRDGIIGNYINNDKNMPLARLSCFWKKSLAVEQTVCRLWQ